jgi:hypothetical protein
MASSRNNALEFSSVGSQILGSSDESTVTNIGAIQVINDTVLATLTSSNVDTSLQALTGATLPAGTIIYGQFSAVKLTTGLVACHKV